MEVKDIIASALTVLGRAEIISALSDVEGADAQEKEIIDTLLYCFNAVEDELARRYIPLVTSEELVSPNTRFYYTSFTHTPSRIRRVTAGGEDVKYEVFTQYLSVQEKFISVEYEYSPKRKKISEESDYGDDVGAYLIALGIAAEYSYINGEAEAAEQWEKKYRAQLDGIRRALPVCGNIPPRRWV